MVGPNGLTKIYFSGLPCRQWQGIWAAFSANRRFGGSNDYFSSSNGHAGRQHLDEVFHPPTNKALYPAIYHTTQAAYTLTGPVSSRRLKLRRTPRRRWGGDRNLTNLRVSWVAYSSAPQTNPQDDD